MAFRWMCVTWSSGRSPSRRRNSARSFRIGKRRKSNSESGSPIEEVVPAMRQNTMHAAALDRFGGIDEIRMQTLPAPEIAPDEVLVRVEVAGVAVWDPYERE